MKDKGTILRSVLTLAALIAIGYYAYWNRSQFGILARIKATDFIVLAVLVVAGSFFNAAQNAVLIRSLGVPFSNLESFGLSNVSAVVNIVVPQGVTLTKAVYLKQRHGVSYSKFSALFLGLLLVFLLTASLLMAITNTAAGLQGIQVPVILWVACAVGAASGLLFALDVPKQFLGRVGKLGKLLEEFSEGWHELRSRWRALLKASLWQVVIFVTSGLSVTMAYRSVGIYINPLLGVSLAVFLALSNLVMIIPGNFGIQEVVYGYLSYISGLLFVQGVVISTLMRAIVLMMILLVAPFSWYLLFFLHKIRVK